MRHPTILLCILWMTVWNFSQTNAHFLAAKLPSTAVPIRYDITLEPKLEELPATFKGKATIELKVLERTNSLTFHASSLVLSKDAFEMKNSNDETVPVANVKIDRFDETCTVVFEHNLQKDEKYQLTITYSGKLRTDNQGFYLAKYENEQGRERLVATTFFTTKNARSAFPCFDEPAFKSRFTIKLIHPENYSALSNQEIISTVNLGNGRVLDVFKETYKMSTYLVAFTITQFNHTERNGFHRVFAKPQDIGSGKTDYILKESAPALAAVENYVDMKYIFPKIDHIAIPSKYFIGQAMENWGLITYSENTLLYSNITSTTTEKQTSFTVMLHEFIHQWFGNLVTPSEWKYLWLSEGFATYLQFRIGDMLKPAWKLQEQFHNIILQRAWEAEDSYNRNSLNDEFGAQWVSYLKAAAIIRMTEHFLTPEVFQKGLQYYLKNNQFGAVGPSELYAALQTAVDENDAAYLLDNNAISDILSTWDTFAHYPIVKVIRNYKNGSVTLEQSTFTPFEYMERNTNRSWYIPINYVFNAKSADDFSKTTADYWLTEKEHTFNRTFATDGWLIVNKKSIGYYRVNYDLINWNRLISFLNSPDFHKIHVLNRAQLISDSFELARHGHLDYKIPLSLSAYLSQERDYVPFSSFFSAMEFFKKSLVNSDVYPNLKSYVINILGGIHEKLGYEESEEDNYLDTFNRPIVINWLCSLGHSECREVALNTLRNWKINESATIAPNLQEALLCGAIRTGNQEDWDFLFKKYQNADSSTESTRILNALSCSENEEIITKYLDKILDRNSTVLKQAHTGAFIAAIESGEIGLKVVNSYIKQHFRESWRLVQMDAVLDAIGGRLTTKEQLEELKAFKSQYPGAHMAFRPGMWFASMNIDWNSKYLPQIKEWFNNQTISNTTI